MEKRTITKRELCERIAKETGLTQVAVKASVQGFLDAIIEELSRGNRLEFRDFGVFDTRVQAARKARNPRTGDEVFVPAKAIAYFKIGKKMEEIVQKALCDRLDEMQAEANAAAAASQPGAAPPAGGVTPGGAGTTGPRIVGLNPGNNESGNNEGGEGGSSGSGSSGMNQ